MFIERNKFFFIFQWLKNLDAIALLDHMSDFMRNMLSAALKSNPHLEKCLMTGILWVSKNTMLSGLNNLETFTLLDREYSHYFGFTEDEVKALVDFCKANNHLDEIRGFYNGYKVGDSLIYNPWSLMVSDELP